MMRIRNNKGLTLVEILITLAVLGIVIMPLMSMFFTSQKMNNESEMKYRAIQFAQEELESIKAMKILNTEDDGYPPRGDGSYGYVTSPDSEGYTIDVRIEKGAEYEGSDIEPAGIPVFDRPIYIITDEDELEIDIAPGIEKIGIEIAIPYDNAKAKIRLVNSDENLKVYIFKNKEHINSYKIMGDATVIEVAENSAKPDNQLYDITVTVEKDGNLIDIIRGTTVFEINPD
ncbi:MAG TPA: type II secretion system protein [Sedimentibacter sp.]|jgi:prepilin-type N-terminal cleavage/methylation domain-containing protein|nr:type II secretion system protein [Sedimentibacter sp.]HOG63054.1 type II secretion system protein [Sedimentibacter sp.]HQO72844.1 type II secretion system protein [Sedimentibacter sp.]